VSSAQHTSIPRDREQSEREQGNLERGTTMHVGLDYLPAVQHAPGVGRYVRELVRALVLRADAPRLSLFEGGLGPRPLEGAPLGLLAARVPVTRRRVPMPRRALELLARCGLGAERIVGRPDLFHRVHPLHPPLSGGLDTLALAELPETGSARDTLVGRAARAAAGVFVFDGTFGERVAARYDLDPRRVAVVPVGCEHWEREHVPPARRTPPELVVLGALRRGREPLRVLAAFEALTRGGVDARLVFVGHPGDAAEDFRAALHHSAARAHVRWIAAPVERDMPGLVGGATALVHLAQDEGSAVTPLEAARLGLAVVASDLPAFRAVFGGALGYVAPGDGPQQVAAQLARALEHGADEGHRALQRQRAATHTWDASAGAHLAAWRRILSGRGGETAAMQHAAGAPFTAASAPYRT
jgi:glycosyltransferase involved in cell wall biosynthesis